MNGAPRIAPSPTSVRSRPVPKKMAMMGVKAVVLDLRGNGGGMFNAADRSFGNLEALAEPFDSVRKERTAAQRHDDRGEEKKRV
ncbi:MAG: hypothetical protein C4293_22390 [Nitrospiraceae bacterium]